VAPPNFASGMQFDVYVWLIGDKNVKIQTRIWRFIMAKAELKHFSKPDEVREFPKGKLELVTIAGATIGRAVFQPGWKWSTSVKPIAKTESCEAPHFQYQISGTLHVKLDDGAEFESKAGDIVNLPSGHDGWVVGNEPVEVVDFQGMVDYAKPK
jgi:hypothetical protein